MNEDRIKKAMDEICIPEGDRIQLWNTIIRKADQHLFRRKRIVTAASILFLLLAVPTSVYAAAHFQWNWTIWGQKNEELDKNFADENETIELQGFRCSLGQTLCDKNLGVIYCYISITDISGKGRNPKDYQSMSVNPGLRAGDITYSITSEGLSFERMMYDAINSTEQTACYYLGAQLNKKAVDEETKININIHQITETIDNKKKNQAEWTLKLIEQQSLKIQNVVSMPTLIWNTEQTGSAEVRVSSIAARVQSAEKPEFQILLKDGSSIKSFTDYTNMDIETQEPFRFETEDEQIYRFDYIDVDEISGIRLNGTFYSADQADRG